MKVSKEWIENIQIWDLTLACQPDPDVCVSQIEKLVEFIEEYFPDNIPKEKYEKTAVDIVIELLKQFKTKGEEDGNGGKLAIDLAEKDSAKHLVLSNTLGGKTLPQIPFLNNNKKEK